MTICFSIVGFYISIIVTNLALRLQDFNKLIHHHRCPAFPCDDVSFSDEAILDKLTYLKVNKSPGPDSLHPRILYEVRHQIVTPTTYDI